VSAGARDRSFADFQKWVEAYQPDVATESVKVWGIALAKSRRDMLRELILSDPARALSMSIPPDVRQQLPREVALLLEERVSDYGDYWVLVTDEIDPADGTFRSARVDRTVTIRGRTYEAAVYGRRLRMTSKRNMPLSGIVIDGVMAVDESPARVLPESELRGLSNRGQMLPGAVAAEVGGRIQYFAGQKDFQAFDRALVEREMMIGPDTEGHKSEIAERGVPQTADSAWTEGPKTVLFIRVDFTDLPGEPVSTATVQSVINGNVDNYYRDNSYDKTSLQVTAVTPTLRMPQSLIFYTSQTDPGGWDEMLSDAEATAKAAGFDPATFSLYIVGTKRIHTFPIQFGGRAYVGTNGTHLNGQFGAEVTEHELGHNYGLHHANYWRTSDASVIGPGTSTEYGDPFDVMGSGFASTDHFNNSYKYLLNWLTPADVQTVQTSGTYRLEACDFRGAAGIRGLRIIRGVRTYYWVEFRQATAGNTFLTNGALIRWGHNDNTRSNLLDMTAGSPPGIQDAPLAVGQTFTDDALGISITALRKVGGSPQALDVSITVSKLAITGQVYTAGAPGIREVAVNLSGSQSGSVQSDNNGSYGFFGLSPHGNYTVTPSSIVWNFTPVSATFNDLSASQTVDFEGVQVSRIAGRVVSEHNLGVAGVTITLGGAQSKSTTTDANGNYAFESLTFGASFTVTPSQAGVSFAPQSVSIPSLPINYTLFFTAIPITNLSVTVNDSPDPLTLGNNVTYTVTVKNLGPAAVRNVVLSEFLPRNVTFVSASATQGALSTQTGGSTTYSIRPDRVPDGFAPDLPLEEAGNDVLQNYLFAGHNDATDFRYQATRVFNTTRALDDSISIYKNYFLTHGWTVQSESAGNPATLSVAKAGTSFLVEAKENTIANHKSIGLYFLSSGLLWRQADMPSGAEATITLVVKPTALGTATSTATVGYNAPDQDNADNSANAVTTVTSDTPTHNPIDSPSFFVTQHYLDFLNRAPDASGLNFWTGEITGCGIDAGCVEVKRVNVSAAFFLSIEFQQTGSLVYKMHKAGFGNLAGKPVAVRRADFIADTRTIGSSPAQVIVGQGNWQAQLEANKQAFALAFVQRAAFQSAHGGQSAADYVDSLFANIGVQPTAAERQAAINAFGGGGASGQAAALRSVAESNSVSAKTFNEAFVLMQYFGYMQRDPDAGPDTDFGGYNFWLGKLNEFNGSFINAEMVKAFISSDEYRKRFGQ
jgi:uncharacterized repeat protein (TIGR01451 family)